MTENIIVAIFMRFGGVELYNPIFWVLRKKTYVFPLEVEFSLFYDVNRRGGRKEKEEEEEEEEEDEGGGRR